MKKVRQAVTQWYGSNDWEKLAKKRQSARIGSRGTGLKASSSTGNPQAKSDGEMGSDEMMDRDLGGEKGKGKEEMEEMKVDEDEEENERESEGEEEEGEGEREDDIHYEDEEGEEEHEKEEEEEE